MGRGEYAYQINGTGRTRDEALRELTHHNYADQLIALNAEAPLGNQAARTRLRRARLQRQSTLASRAQRELAIR